MPPRRRLTRTLAALLLACFTHAANAQTTTTPAPFRVGLHVADEKGLSIDNVRPEDVRVTLGGVEQAVSLLARDGAPLSVGLVVDNSGSLRDIMGLVVAAARTIVRTLRPGDEAFVVSFISDKDIKLLHDFTADRAALERALGEMAVGKGPTHVFEALHFSIGHLTAKGPAAGARRRALVFISDGEDARNYYYDDDDVVRRLREHDVEVFCIGLRGTVSDRPRIVPDGAHNTFPTPEERADALLLRLARETGGRAFIPTRGGELKEALAEVVLGLRGRYVVEFVPTGKGGRPAAGKLEIKVSGGPGQPARQAFYRPWVFKKGAPERKK